MNIPPLDMEAIKELIDFIDPSRKIVIGESASQIPEGEPFLHPKLFKILTLLRTRFPDTLIQLTTNGSLVTGEKLKALKQFEPLELNISLNILNRNYRENILGDRPPYHAVELLAECNKLGIKFNGSVVALPFIYGWQEIYRTLNYLEDCKAMSVRLLIPGYTRFLKNKKLLDSKDSKFFRLCPREFSKELMKLRNYYRVPIFVEPPLLEDLTPELAGVMESSPASKMGLKAKDKILKVNDREVFSRAHAYNLLKTEKDPEIIVEKNEQKLTLHEKLNLKKEKNVSSGICFDNDILPQRAKNLIEMAKKYENTLVLASTGGYNLLKEAVKKIDKQEGRGKEDSILEDRLVIEGVENYFFGGNIISAGLLIIEDFRHFIADNNISKRRDYEKVYDQIILPAKAFDFRGVDLLGEHYKALEEETGIKVNISN